LHTARYLAVIVARSGNQPWGGLQGTSGEYYLSVKTEASLQQTLTGLDPGRIYTLAWDAAERPTHNEVELFRLEVGGCGWNILLDEWVGGWVDELSGGWVDG